MTVARRMTAEEWARAYPTPQQKAAVLAREAPPETIRRFTSKRRPWWRDGREHPEHLFIPDTQVKAGVPIEHIRWAAQYAIDHKPDVIVTGNDWFDFPSLSMYEAEWADFKTRDLIDDLCAGLHAWDLFRDTLATAKGYDPLIVFVEGNHDERFRRMFRYDRRFQRALRGPRSLVTERPGVTWARFEEIVEIDGVYYSHLFVNPMTGKPIGGTALNKLSRLKFSFTMGHQQVKESAEQHLANGQVIRGLVAGAFYQHREDYKGPQGNLHWRGLIYKHEVRDGNYDLMEVSIDFLRRRYGGKRVLADPHHREDEFSWEADE